MKYIAPQYMVETIESEDIMEVSANVSQTDTETNASMTLEDLVNMFNK